VPEFLPVAQQMDAILRDALEVIPLEELERKLHRSAASGQPLVVKQGFDPTRPDLHLGHAVSLRMLRTFQELGHQVVFVVGDYTALVGDPTGRSELRPRLTEDEVRENARTYREQVFRILDPERTRIEFNSRWLAPLRLADVLALTSHYTVARMMEREDFQKRYADGKPISVVEFMYPLLTAYDSVALQADVELGGSDQKFNLLVHRAIQERYGQAPQVCVTLPILRGTDGVQKMSKSYDNYVGLADAPEEQYGRTMSIPDTLLDEWWRLASGLSGAALEGALDGAREDPYRSKRALAARVVATYHGPAAATAAAEHFDRVFRQHETPAEVPEHSLRAADPALAAGAGAAGLPRVLVQVGLARSNSEAMRLIDQGAVAVDGERVGGRDAVLAAPGTYLLRRGKRHFARVRLEAS
jgi:tyrosyl-tRNA synthetase